MSDLQKTFRLLNLNATLKETLGPVAIWSATPIFGNPNQNINILHITGRPTNDQLGLGLNSIGRNRDYALISTIQEIDRLKNRLIDVGFQRVATTREILSEGIRGLLGAPIAVELPRATIEPILTDQITRRAARSTLHIQGWLENQESQRLAIITGPAGFGKTTLCQILVNRLYKDVDLQRVPLFITSNHWRQLLERHQVTVRQIFLEAVAQTYKQAALGEEMIGHLISTGALIPIFDGLDEICTDAYTEIGIPEILAQLDDMFAEDDQARTIFTSRTTFWDTVRVSDRLRFQEFVVRPFDQNQRAQFLDDWFGRDNVGKGKVLSLLGRIEALGSGAARGGEDRTFKFSESPYIIHLASIAAEEQKGAGFGPESWANVRDPLDAILNALAEREVKKNRIPVDKQNKILFSLALTKGESFLLDDFSDIVNFYAEQGERLEGMLSHHVISGRGDERRFLFDGFGDYLRAKAIANWIFRQENEIIGIDDYLKQVTSESDSSVDIFGEISGFYASIAQLQEAFAERRVLDYFNGRMGQGLLFLFLRACRKHYGGSREELKEAFVDSLLGGSPRFEGLQFSGQLEGISFSGITFDRCKFEDVVLRYCDFDSGSGFINCEFKGDFAVYSCDQFEEALLQSDDLSPSARAVFAARNVKGADRRVTESDVTTILDYIFSQMQTPQLGYRDISREGLLSRVQKKNSYIANTVLDVLQSEGVLVETRAQQRHRTRVGIGKPEDVIAFHREGAAIRSIRDAIEEVLRKFD